MKKTLIATVVASALLAPAFAQAQEHTFTPNVGVVSDYIFRGISQSAGDPALQGGLDYAHSSGLYAGIWGSTIKWVENAQDKNVPVEIDLYGGYKSTFGGGDWNYDVGFIAYQYPNGGGRNSNAAAEANTREVYAALGWKFLTLKYSIATSNHFVGWKSGPNTDGNTKGSDYLELNANYDLGNGWGVLGHVGKQSVRGFSGNTYESASYMDWKIGVTKDVGFGVVGLSYSDTDVKGTCGPTGGTNPYCWGEYSANTNTSRNFRNVANSQVVLSFNKTF